MTKLTPAQQNVVTALKEGKTIRRSWLNSTFRYADTGKAIAEPTVKVLSIAGIVQFKREGDYFYLVLKDTDPQPVKANTVELESAPQPHETVAITGIATTEPVAPIAPPKYLPGETIIDSYGHRIGTVIRATDDWDAEYGWGYEVEWHTPVAPRPVNMSAYDYETRPGLHRAAKKGVIEVKTLTGMSITRARVVAGKIEVLERGGCWHVVGRNDTLIVGV